MPGRLLRSRRSINVKQAMKDCHKLVFDVQKPGNNDNAITLIATDHDEFAATA